ncbi:MAG: hypothetical protein VX438_13085 [Planctomycetota bacterium]|nr:hypothetical protein [Planctomycetota bacterium]
MARFFSFLEKKKGHRQSGSRLLGGLSAVLIYSSILLIGVVLFVTLLTYQIGLTSYGEFGYTATGFWIRIVVTLLMIGVGGFQTLNTIWALGVSPERKSAISISASSLNITQAGQEKSAALSSVPNHEFISNSPGVRLKHRLPVTNESLWLFFSIAFLCVALLVVASALTVLVVNGIVVNGTVNWIALGMTPIFVLGAIWAIVRFFGQLLEIAAVGPSNIEIAEHPLHPGQTYQVFLFQSGLLKFRRIDLVLACFEHVTYQQGTDVRTETRRISQKRIMRIRNLKLDPSQPFEHQSEITIPDNAMHSFHSPCNMVSWVLILTAVSNRWPRFTRRFPVIVHPAS